MQSPIMAERLSGSFGQFIFDAWQNFVYRKEIPRIENKFMNWMIALWVQIFVFEVVLIFGYLKLYKASKIAHNMEVNSIKQPTTSTYHNGLYIPDLQELVSSYHYYFDLASREV